MDAPSPIGADHFNDLGRQHKNKAQRQQLTTYYQQLTNKLTVFKYQTTY